MRSGLVVSLGNDRVLLTTAAAVLQGGHSLVSHPAPHLCFRHGNSKRDRNNNRHDLLSIGFDTFVFMMIQSFFHSHRMQFSHANSDRSGPEAW